MERKLASLHNLYFPWCFFKKSIPTYPECLEIFEEGNCDDKIALWIQSTEDAEKYLEHLNTFDASSKIKFTIQIENENNLEFPDLRFKLKILIKSWRMLIQIPLVVLHM